MSSISIKVPGRALKLFYTYSQKDERLFRELETHLKQLEGRYIAGWHSCLISPGTDWRCEIRAHLYSADIILLLVSADFFASDYYNSVELKQAIEKRHSTGKARIIPIILRDCSWEETMIGQLKPLPDTRKAVKNWSNRDSAWKQITQGIRLLWAKSVQDLEMIDITFNLYIEPFLTTITISDPTPIEDASLSSQDIPISFDPVSPSDNYSPPDSVSSFDHSTSLDTFSPSEWKFEIVAEQNTYVQGTSYHIPLYQSAKEPNYPLITTSPNRVYHMQSRLPLDKREMIEACRHLRRPQRTGVPEELDVEKTIQSICQTGFFLGPVLQPRRRNRARILLLLDQQGSMVPFSPLTTALTESILACNLSDETRLHYFHDCPEDFLYEEPTLAAPRPLTEVLAEQVKHDAVLIVSDAGAARGHYNAQRVDNTKTFIQVLNTYTYLYTWINPLPPERWTATTAEDIARLVPMFPLTREGLHDAIGILQGHPFPPGVDIDG